MDDSGEVVRAARDRYLAENGFTLDSYDDPWVTISYGPIAFPFPNPPSRRVGVRFHDLHHVLTGYGTDPIGEGEISAWELRRGLKGLSPFVAGLVIAGAFVGMIRAPRRTLRAWRASAGGTNLFDTPLEHYEALLDEPVASFRRRLGVPAEGLATDRHLHSGAPKAAPPVLKARAPAR